MSVLRAYLNDIRHPERSEGSGLYALQAQMFRVAQHDGERRTRHASPLPYTCAFMDERISLQKAGKSSGFLLVIKFSSTTTSVSS